jgi:hypothetical protein
VLLHRRCDSSLMNRHRRIGGPELARAAIPDLGSPSICLQTAAAALRTTEDSYEPAEGCARRFLFEPA